MRNGSGFAEIRKKNWPSYRPYTRFKDRNTVIKRRIAPIKEEKDETKKDYININDTPIVKGDICRVLNKYKGLQGLEFKVTKVTGDKIHFLAQRIPYVAYTFKRWENCSRHQKINK